MLFRSLQRAVDGGADVGAVECRRPAADPVEVARGAGDLGRDDDRLTRPALKLIARFGGKPVVWVGGNHDYVNLAELLRENGYENAFDATIEAVEIGGHRFAGMDSIPWIAGEWRNEEHDLTPMVERVIAMNPTILVTHAPPAGILDAVGYGVRPLTTALAYQPHQIVAHLFGHVHENGCQDIEEMGIRFYNNAENVRFIEVP